MPATIPIHALSRDPIDPDSKRRVDSAIDWLRATIVDALGNPDAYGVVTVQIKLQGGKVPGSVVLTNERHFR